MDERNLAEIIAKHRKDKGMTQVELASIMGVTDKAVSKWERGLSYPDVASYPRLAEALDISVEELMGFSEKRDDDKKILDVALKAVATAMGAAVCRQERDGHDTFLD